MLVSVKHALAVCSSCNPYALVKDYCLPGRECVLKVDLPNELCEILTLSIAQNVAQRVCGLQTVLQNQLIYLKSILPLCKASFNLKVCGLQMA